LRNQPLRRRAKKKIEGLKSSPNKETDYWENDREGGHEIPFLLHGEYPSAPVRTKFEHRPDAFTRAGLSKVDRGGWLSKAAGAVKEITLKRSVSS